MSAHDIIMEISYLSVVFVLLLFNRNMLHSYSIIHTETSYAKTKCQKSSCLNVDSLNSPQLNIKVVISDIDFVTHVQYCDIVKLLISNIDIN